MDYLTFRPPCISGPDILKRWPPKRLLFGDIKLIISGGIYGCDDFGMKKAAEWNGSSRPAKLRRQVSFALLCSDASV